MFWILKKFDELSSSELYDILRLRNEVFVVEQNCVFQDADNKDQNSYHLMGMEDGRLLAYTRIVPPGEIYQQPSIGRVVTSPDARGKGFGKELMQQSIKMVYTLFGQQPIMIGAQCYLKKFYEELGFLQSGEIYPEDGIDHMHMIKR
jgi:ElaA protein